MISARAKLINLYVTHSRGESVDASVIADDLDESLLDVLGAAQRSDGLRLKNNRVVTR